MKVAVIGASLGGLAVANSFHSLGAKVHVFEKFEHEFSARGSSLGFVDVSLWEELCGARMMRRGRQASRAQGAFYYGDLWRFLYSGLPEGTVRFGRSIHDLGGDATHPTIDGEAYDLCILADGGWSKLRHLVTSSLPEYAGYVCWRGKVAADRLDGFDAFGIHKNGEFDTIALPCPTDDGRNLVMGAVFIATPEDEVRRPQAGASRHVQVEQDAPKPPDWFLPLYRQRFGTRAGGSLVRLFEAFAAHGELAPHPQYDYAAEQVVAGRIVLVGDAAHMASPRTAAGAHTAVLDALALREVFQRALAAGLGVDQALSEYNRDAVARAAALHARSREVATQFVPPGGLRDVRSPSTLVAPAC